MRSRRALASALAAGLLLTGCEPRAGAGGEEIADGSVEAMERATKLTTYTLALGDETSLAGFDPVADLERYEQRGIPTAKPDVKVSLFPRGIEQALTDLTRARGEAGKLPALDAAADRTIPALARLLQRARGLESYYATRGSLSDDLARGRREHPQLIADYQAVIATWAPLRQAYDRAIADKLVHDAAFYKREKRMADYYDVLLVQKAGELARTIGTPEAARDPQRALTAERIVGALMALAQRDRAAQAERAKNPDAAGMDRGIPDSIEQMIGAWRDLRRTPDAEHWDAMMSPYRSARQSVSLS